MRKSNRGFTLAEIIIVISVIGMLATIGIISFINIQKFTRDKQRYNQITIIGEALEKYYDQNGKYPACSDSDKSLETQPTSILTDTDEKVFITPSSSSASIKCVASTTDTDDKFYYFTAGLDGSQGWELKYYSELEKQISVNTIKNRRQYTASTTSLSTTYLLTTSSNPAVGGNINNGGGQHSANSQLSLTAAANTGWRFTGWSNCSASTSDSITIIMNSDKICVANFLPTTPTMTTVTANTVGNVTTWSWGSVICPNSTQANFTYRYSTSQVDSGWQIASNAEPLDNSNYFADSSLYKRITFWEGYDYTVKIKAKCVYSSDATITSDWSDEKQATYTRALIAPGNIAMTLVRGTSGSTYTNNSAMIRFKPTCSGGATMIISYDAKQADIYRWNLELINPATGEYYRGQWWRDYQNRLGNGYEWLSYTNYPIYPDTGRSYVVDVGWIKWVNGYSITIVNSIDNVPTTSGSGWGALVKAKCTANGRYSEEKTFTDTNVYVGKNPL